MFRCLDGTHDPFQGAEIIWKRPEDIGFPLLNRSVIQAKRFSQLLLFQAGLLAFPCEFSPNVYPTGNGS